MNSPSFSQQRLIKHRHFNDYTQKLNRIQSYLNVDCFPSNDQFKIETFPFPIIVFIFIAWKKNHNHKHKKRNSFLFHGLRSCKTNQADRPIDLYSYLEIKLNQIQCDPSVAHHINSKKRKPKYTHYLAIRVCNKYSKCM